MNNVKFNSFEGVNYSNFETRKKTLKIQNVSNKTFLADTVSFKGKTLSAEVAKKGKKTILTALASLAVFLGIKKTTSNNSPMVQNKTEQDSLLTESQKLARKLATQVYSRDLPNGYTRYYNSFNETAVDGIVKLYEETQDPEKVFELAKILEEKETLSPDDTLYVIEKYKENPNRVSEFKLNRQDFFINILKSCDISEELTREIVQKMEKNGLYCYQPNVISDFVENAHSLDLDTVKKYLNESRVPLNLKTVIDLTKLDKDYSKEIEQIIGFIKQTGIPRYDISDTFVAEILPHYIEDYQSVRRLTTVLEKADAKQMIPLIKAYNVDPELTETLIQKIAKDSHCKPSKVSGEKVAEMALNIHSNKERILALAGIDWDFVDFKTLTKMLDDINANPTTIDRIIKDGRCRNYKKFIDIYNKYPDKEITDKLISRANDPLAKIFDLA